MSIARPSTLGGIIGEGCSVGAMIITVLQHYCHSDPGMSHTVSLLNAVFLTECPASMRHFSLDNDHMLLIRFDIGRRGASRERPGGEHSRLPANQSCGGVSGRFGRYTSQLGASRKAGRIPPPHQRVSIVSQSGSRSRVVRYHEACDEVDLRRRRFVVPCVRICG